MHRPTLLLIDLNSPPTSRRSSILRRSSPVTTEIDLALTQYATQVFSITTTSLSFHYYPSLEKTKSHLLPLLLVLQVSTKVCSHLENKTSRLQASDAEACSFYKLGLNRLLQEFLVHHNLPNKIEPLTREVIKWNQKYLSSKTPSSNLSPAACLFVPDKVPLPSNPPPGTEPKSGGGSALLPRKSLEEGTITFAPTVDQRIISYQPALSPSSSTLTLLSLIDTSKSPTILVTIHGPLGKIKFLALLDTGTDANFIEEKLAKLIGLSASSSLDVKVGNSTIIGAIPILQTVTIDLEGSPFCVTCNFSPNLSFPFILGFI
ncbi:hypothetical protein DSO57_1025907 [Entomophthora muscae]|uniref:Uncharacterized protein n=1 Tax=Entomophthora muscae TaxID=34485 RepID=A0ACC2RGU7_9FUNG|nr:hypothetical protein DSO57_1025907 [Entomophthora muscae]